MVQKVERWRRSVCRFTHAEGAGGNGGARTRRARAAAGSEGIPADSVLRAQAGNGL